MFRMTIVVGYFLLDLSLYDFNELLYDGFGACLSTIIGFDSAGGNNWFEFIFTELKVKSLDFGGD